jgi:phosphatidylserine/phosphatidylglycerophosphate/cardiolipin synthase-like enzyme
MRDHRKLVIYDLNERDPYRGALLLMGVGIGEHYASATWEDRGYRVRGPATLEARRALREALRRNGFREDQLPAALRPVEPEDAIEADADTRDYVGRALQVHNQAGFGRKESSVARAMLYNLAPPGSVIIVPDPMWLSDTWAGMLAAAAARGCRVYIIAPAAANAPSPQKPLLAVERRILGRLLELHSLLDPAIRRAGGDLRVGLFTAHAAIDDPVGRRREIREGLARFPWIRQVVPFDDRTLAVLEQPGVVSASGQDATALAHDEKPRDLQLHQKSQLIARPGAIAALLRQPGWDDALARSLRMQTEETARFADQIGFMTPVVDTLATRANDALLRGYEQAVPEAERKRVSFYFSVGTQNEDDRGIVSDAEATLIVSGVQASAGLVDLFTVMARSDWITTDAELARYVPVSRGWMSGLAWKLRAAF